MVQQQGITNLKSETTLLKRKLYKGANFTRIVCQKLDYIWCCQSKK